MLSSTRRSKLFSMCGPRRPPMKWNPSAQEETIRPLPALGQIRFPRTTTSLQNTNSEAKALVP